MVLVGSVTCRGAFVDGCMGCVLGRENPPRGTPVSPAAADGHRALWIHQGVRVHRALER